MLKQRGTDLEYIVLDGSSADGTVQVLELYQKLFEKKGITYKIISKPDSGIYNAMNNALESASGDWILYLNAGDRLYTEKLSDIVSNINTKDCDVIYGDVLLTEKGYYKKKKADDHRSLLTKMPMCHQSVLCRTDLVKKYKFREEYRLAADYDLLLRFLRDGKKFSYVHKVISVFPLDGTSTKHAWRYQSEMMKSRNNVEGLNLIDQCKSLYHSIIRIGKIWGANCFPVQYHSYKRGWRKIKRYATE